MDVAGPEIPPTCWSDATGWTNRFTRFRSTTRSPRVRPNPWFYSVQPRPVPYKDLDWQVFRRAFKAAIRGALSIAVARKSQIVGRTFASTGGHCDDNAAVL